MSVKALRVTRHGKPACAQPTGTGGTNGCAGGQCKCGCGGDCMTTIAQLDRDDPKNSGCLQCGPQLLREGQRFGMLVVLGYAGIQDRRRSWLCRCDCGNECIVSGSSLKSGKRKSCGCIRPSKKRDLSGQRFGSLLVTGFSGKKHGRNCWLCRCDCGNVTEVWQTNLLSGHTKSCGCLQSKTYRDNLLLVDGTSVTIIENRMKTPIKSNTSGYNGVYLNKHSGKWCAQITFKGRTYFLGAFENIQDAVKARKRAEEKLFDDFLTWYHEQKKASAL